MVETMREKILIAENNPQSLNKLSHILTQNNYHVITASKREEMIEHIKKDPPELLLLSYTLPQIDDPGLLENLHRDYEDTFIIYIINKENEAHIRNIVHNKADDYLIEPFDDCKFLATIDNALKFRHIKIRNKMICQELVDANQKLSLKTQQFQELVDFHNSILEDINVGIFTIDSQFNITSWNKKIHSLTGVIEKDAIGQNIFSLIPVLREDNLHQRICQVVHHGKTTELGHIQSLNPLGETICCAYKISPLRENEHIRGAVILVDDITQKINLRQELYKTQRYLSNLVENSADAIISFDLNGTIVTWNRGAEIIYGYSAQEAIGKKWDILILPSLHDQMAHLFEWVKESSSVKNLEMSLINREGREIPVTMSLSWIKDTEGNVFGLSCIARDLSEKRDLQDQIIHTQKMASLGTMAAGMAHDINNPLSSILAYAELMVNKTEKIGYGEITEHLFKVEEDVDRIANLVKKVLWYSRPTSQVKLININDLLEKAIEFAHFQTPLHHIEIIKNFDPNLPQISGKSKELVQAFVNLITNAVKAMPTEGTLTLKTGVQKDTLAHDEIAIIISDVGVGIPEKNLGKIFEYCFTTRNNEKGNGLGLYVVKAIIEENGGSIQVQSKVNEGTVFTITLPIKEEGKAHPFI